MLEIMLMIFIFTGKCFNYKMECSSHHAEHTFLCMRPNPRGPTPSMTEMDDRLRDEKSDLHSACIKETLYSFWKISHINRFRNVTITAGG